MFWLIGAALWIVFYITVIFIQMYHKGLASWFPTHMKKLVTRVVRGEHPIHVILTFSVVFDAYNNPGEDIRKRLFEWEKRMSAMAGKHRDCMGKPPIFTYYIPHNTDGATVLSSLSRLCFNGTGEIELYVGHELHTSDAYQKQFIKNLDRFSEFGINVFHDKAEQKNKRSFSVIYDENHDITGDRAVLTNHGCYADFSLPRINRSQAHTYNRLYYYSPLPHGEYQKNFLHVSGSIGVDFFDWRNIFAPRLDLGLISKSSLPSAHRVWLWDKTSTSIPGRPDWIVIKLCTRIGPNNNDEVMLERHIDRMFNRLEKKIVKKPRSLHYVSSRELYNIIKAAEEGKNGNPSLYRDRTYPRYINQYITASCRFVVEHMNTESFLIRIIDNEMTRILCNFFPITEFYGCIKSVKASYDINAGVINIMLTGSGSVMMHGRLPTAVSDVSGANIVSLSVHGKDHDLQLESDVRGYQNINIKLLNINI